MNVDNFGTASRSRYSTIILIQLNDLGCSLSFDRPLTCLVLFCWAVRCCVVKQDCYQSAVPSNWLLFSGVIPFEANNCPRGESTLILPLMKG